MHLLGQRGRPFAGRGPSPLLTQHLKNRVWPEEEEEEENTFWADPSAHSTRFFLQEKLWTGSPSDPIRSDPQIGQGPGRRGGPGVPGQGCGGRGKKSAEGTGVRGGPEVGFLCVQNGCD